MTSEWVGIPFGVWSSSARSRSGRQLDGDLPAQFRHIPILPKLPDIGPLRRPFAEDVVSGIERKPTALNTSYSVGE